MTVKHNYTQAGAVNPASRSTERAAYSPAEFAASCGRHPSWAYRLLYGGKIRALTDLGRILIPASKLERVLATAARYNPRPRRHKSQPAGCRKEKPGGPGIWASGSNSPPARTGYKSLRHTIGGAA